MKAKLVAMALCGLFTLALVTVRLKTREVLLKYEIADLETFEVLLHERFTYLKSEVERETGILSLLKRAAEMGIRLELEGFDGEAVPIVTPVEDVSQLD
jgi:hypothetical protein